MEIREEVSRLVCNKLRSPEGFIDGRVVEAVGSVESDVGLEKLREVLVDPSMNKPWYKKWGILGLCLILLFIGVWLVQSLTYDPKASNPLQATKLLGFIGGITIKGSAVEFTDEEKFLLYGDQSMPTRVERMYALWQSDPTNKQFAAEAVFEYKNEYDIFPEDLLEVGESVDPDNPWYLYLEASQIAKMVVSKTEKDKKNEEDATEYEYEVQDRDEFEKALTLIEVADSMGKLKDHRWDLLERRLEIYSKNQDHDFFSKMAFLAEAYGFSSRFGLELLRLDSIFSAKFNDLSVSGDKEEVKKWLGIYKRFIDSVLNTRGSAIEILVTRALLQRMTIISRAALERVGMDEELEKIKKLNKLLEEDRIKIKNLRKQSKLPLESGEYGLIAVEHIDSSLVSLTPIEFDPNDHVPDRYSMHSFVSKHLAAFYAVLIFILLFFVSCYLLYKGKLARFFGGRVLGMLNVKDWAVIIFGGVFAPIIFYYVINQHTPLGVRKWNVLAADGMSLIGQFTSMILLMIMASYCLLRWRLSERSFGLVRRTDWCSWSALASCLLAMLLIGCNGYEMSWMVYTTFGLLIYTAGFMLVRGTRGMISNERLISVAGINRGMIMLLMLITICTALLAPFYYADEKKWIREDKLITLNPKHLGIDSREYRIMQAMREELRERLDMIR